MKHRSLFVKSFVVGLALLMAGIAVAWTPPDQAPPNSAIVKPPINQSTANQTKSSATSGLSDGQIAAGSFLGNIITASGANRAICFEGDCKHTWAEVTGAADTLDSVTAVNSATLHHISTGRVIANFDTVPNTTNPTYADIVVGNGGALSQHNSSIMMYSAGSANRIYSSGNSLYFNPYNQPAASGVVIDTAAAGGGSVTAGTLTAGTLVGTIANVAGGSTYGNWASLNVGGSNSIQAIGSIYSYDSVCVGENTGHCNGSGGSVITPTTIRSGGGVTLTGAAAHLTFGDGTYMTTAPSAAATPNLDTVTAQGASTPRGITINATGQWAITSNSTYGIYLPTVGDARYGVYSAGAIQAQTTGRGVWAGTFVGTYGLNAQNDAGYYAQLATGAYGLYTNGAIYASGATRSDGGFCIGGSCISSWPAAAATPSLDAVTAVGAATANNISTGRIVANTPSAVSAGSLGVGDLVMGNGGPLGQHNSSIEMWSASNASRIYSTGSTLYFTQYQQNPANTNAVAIDTSGGNIFAKVFYDADNSGYYLNPNGISNVSRIQGSEIYRSYGYWDAMGVEYDVDNAGYYMNPSSVSSVNQMYAAAFLYSSDKRLKEDLQPIAGSLEKVRTLTGYSFIWKEGTPKAGQHDIGVIAQEVEAVAPEAVHTDAQGIKSVDYARLVPLLINAIKEQQGQIDTLKADVAELKSR